MVSPRGVRDVMATDLGGYFLVARGRGASLAGGRRRPGGERHDEPRDDEPEGVRAYGPALAGAEARSRIMVADLAGSPVTVNLLLPGGAALTRLIPEDLPEEMRDAALPNLPGVEDY